MSIDREAITNGHGGHRQHSGNGVVEQLLTVTELAERLQLSEKTIRRMIAGGRLPCVRLGRQLRFSTSDIVRWVSARKEG